MKNLFKRFKEETPKFWRNVTKLSISLKVGAGAVVATNLVTPLPEDLVTYSAWLLGICVFITTYAESRVKSTKTNE